MSTIDQWSKTAASNNSTPPDGWPENQNASTVNDCAREMMAAIRTQWEIAQWFDFGDTPVYVSATTFTIAGDVTAEYIAGRAIRCYGPTLGTLYRHISVNSTYSAPNTTVTVDAGTLLGDLSQVYLGIVSDSNSVPILDTQRLNTPQINEAVNITSTSTELNYVDGVTSAIQTQMDLKAPLASPAITGTPTINGGNVRDAADEYTTNGVTASLATATAETFALTHGLGTDDVLVEVAAFGSSTNAWSALSKTPDSYTQGHFGGNAVAAVLAVSTPASGDIGFSIHNNAGVSQTITYRIRIFKRDV